MEITGIYSNSEKFQHLLGEDLLKLINDFNVDLIEVTPVSPLTSPTVKRGSFRLQFSKGQCLKGRRYATVEHAKRVHQLSRYLGTANFPQVISQFRSAMLIVWLDGKPLS